MEAISNKSLSDEATMASKYKVTWDALDGNGGGRRHGYRTDLDPPN